MTHRAFVFYDNIQPSNTAGTFQLVGHILLMDDLGTAVHNTGLYVNFQWTQTGAQILTAILAEVSAASAAAGFTIGTASGQILYPSMTKV
jgi:hypothetical protein